MKLSKRWTPPATGGVIRVDLGEAKLIHANMLWQVELETEFPEMYASILGARMRVAVVVPSYLKLIKAILMKISLLSNKLAVRS